jgi:hypothetical protein
VVADRAGASGRTPRRAAWRHLARSTGRRAGGRRTAWRHLARSTGWRAGCRRAAAIGTLLVTMPLVGACTSGGSPDPAAPGASTAAQRSTNDDGPTGVPATDLAAIRSAIEKINATAGGSVAAQRAELETLAAPQQLAQQRACPAAHSTLKFQPAYRDLRTASPEDIGTAPAPGTGIGETVGAEPSGAVTGSVTDGIDAPAGTAYLLPAFITIYTGSRITGTDLTTLRLWVTGGVARTGALCVS